MNSWTTLTASFLDVSKVAIERLKVCQPIRFVSLARSAAGRRCRTSAESNQIGERPDVPAEAKTQSSSARNGVCARHSSNAAVNASGMGIGSPEARVFKLVTRLRTLSWVGVIQCA